jgi:hypothetical protein
VIGWKTGEVNGADGVFLALAFSEVFCRCQQSLQFYLVTKDFPTRRLKQP